MTAAFEMTLETLSLNRPYYLNEVGLRGKSSLFNSAWMRAPSQTTCNGQVFAREDYVEEAWRIVDPVLKAGTPVLECEPNTWGPSEVNERVCPPEGWQDPVVKAN